MTALKAISRENFSKNQYKIKCNAMCPKKKLELHRHIVIIAFNYVTYVSMWFIISLVNLKIK